LKVKATKCGFFYVFMRLLKIPDLFLTYSFTLKTYFVVFMLIVFDSIILKYFLKNL